MVRWLWLAFALFVVYGTTIPFDFDPDPASVAARLGELPLNPFVRLDGRRVSIPDAVQNIALFVPFGVLGGLALSGARRGRGSVAATVTLAAAGLSLAVEGLQLLTTSRVPSTSDVLMNTVGGLLGVWIAEDGRRRAVAWVRRYAASPWMANRWAYPVLCLATVLAVSAWQPFDVTLDVGSVGSKVLDLVRRPGDRGPLTDEGNAFVIYALGTMAFALWFDASGVSRARWRAVPVAGLLACGLELSQAFVGSRTPSWWDLGVRLGGVLAGAPLASVGLLTRWPRWWLGLLYVGTVAGVGLSLLSPFEIRAEPRPFGWLPFEASVARSTVPAVSHVLELALLYFPWAFVWATVRGARSVVAAAAVVGLLTAGCIEGAQAWVVDRYPDVTDVLISTMGAAIGAWCGGEGARRFARVRDGLPGPRHLVPIDSPSPAGRS